VSCFFRADLSSDLPGSFLISFCSHGSRPFDKLRAGCGLHSFDASRLDFTDSIINSIANNGIDATSLMAEGVSQHCGDAHNRAHLLKYQQRIH
jgi:hypothetical protein